MIRLERVIDALPADFEAMRAEARAEGFGMLDTLAAEWSSGAMPLRPCRRGAATPLIAMVPWPGSAG